MLKLNILVACAIWALALSDKAAQAQCRDGAKAGLEEANKKWRSEFGENCERIYKFEEKARNDLINGNFAYDYYSDTWKTEAYKECAQEAVETFISEMLDECLSNPELCQQLGDLAAGKVVYSFCPESVSSDCSTINGVTMCSMSSGLSQAVEPDYPKICREIAINWCKGTMYDRIKEECNPTAYEPNVFDIAELVKLMEKCESEVDKRIK